MILSADDIVQVHASFAAADELVEQRRAVYLVAIELLAGRELASACRLDVLDNPLTRAHLGEVIGGTAELSVGHLLSLDELVDSRSSSAGDDLRVASAPAARTQLAAALQCISRELGPSSEHRGGGLRVLTGADAEFDRVAQHVSGGVRLLAETAPGLARDLMRHIALAVVLAHDGSEALGSASAREFPGLVVVPQPASDLEFAEAVIHEGAHQKFFDLCITRDVLLGAPFPAEFFTPSWAVPRTRWPLEQAMAAFHAYCCLGAMFDGLLGKRPELSLHSFSLLSKARERAEEIREWLCDRGEALGSDGRSLVTLLGGAPVKVANAVEASWRRPSQVPSRDDDVIVRRVGGRTLVARRARPIELFWTFSGTSNVS